MTSAGCGGRRASATIAAVKLTPFLAFTDDVIVKRLRWVMAGAMLFSLFNALAGQPKSYWLHPETAIRGDGLGVHNPLNHTFEFFLSHGWMPCVAAFLVYLALALAIVSLLPREPALVAIFSVLLGHFFGATNWLVVRWHLGFTGAALYSFLVGAAVAVAASPLPAEAGDFMARRLRWLMVAVMLMDPLLTLVGQPGSYWLRPETVHEGNPFWRWVMQHGWWAYVLADAVYCGGALLLASRLPRFFAWVCLLGFTFGHFVGGSCWFFYEWRLGMEAPVIYGTLISALMVWLAFSGPDTAPQPVPSAPWVGDMGPRHDLRRMRQPARIR